MIPSEESIEFAEILCARLCHDLAGPAGAVMAGAELLSDSGDDAEAFQILQSSAVAISARLKFMRSVFGPPQATKIRGVSNLARALLATSPGYELVWESVEGDTMLPGEVGRNLLLLILLARDCLPRGGRICVCSCLVSPLSLSVRAEGDWVDAILPDAAENNKGGQKTLTVKTAPGQLLKVLAQRAGGVFSAKAVSGHLLLSVQ